MSRHKLKALAAALPLRSIFMEVQDIYMHRCLQLAALGSGFVAPNPLVGAVLVYEGRMIGEGWHQKYGEAHAEVNCLNSVTQAERHLIPDSTLFVSLEPCAHFGKTPPCANRILQEGIKKVVVGARDPFEKVNGKGIEILQNAGVEVVTGVLEKECRWQNRRFFTFHEKQRPYIHLKWAETADGFMGSAGNERLMITEVLTGRMVHKWRSEEAAIMVGTQTALLDNPSLNNRFWSGAQPLRIVVDGKLILPQNLNLLSDGTPTLVLNGLKESREGNLHYKKVEGLQTHDPKVILQALFEENIQSVLIEGGAALLTSFLETGLWDEVHLLRNTTLVALEGIKAPAMPKGKLLETRVLRSDRIEWIVNS
jgi:diaminohydroxyphosphoribosylaminopyrimidine deaminase/5-amino-6-(5-phosphoribosylamino)uracil reductase